jgi:hypothetical protein
MLKINIRPPDDVREMKRSRKWRIVEIRAQKAEVGIGQLTLSDFPPFSNGLQLYRPGSVIG